MTEQVVAYVEPAKMSNGALVGLVNVATSDGQHYFDLTLGQLRSLAERDGWQIVTETQTPPIVVRFRGGRA